MPELGYVLEKVRHRSQLTSAEASALAEELARVQGKLEGCAQEVARRDEAEKVSRQQERDRAERTRSAEEETERAREALAHEKQQRETEVAGMRERVTFLENVLRDVRFGLLNQPDLTREDIASAVSSVVPPSTHVPS